MDKDRHRKVMEVFLAASEVEGDRREQILEKTGGEDSDLRSEVEALLKQDNHATITRPAIGEGGSGAVPELVHASSAERYEILEEIARGGTAVILRARDRNLDRIVALKRLLESQLDNPEAKRRLHREAMISGRLDHPGIPAVHEIGKFEDGEAYIALRLVHGKTLSRLLKEREKGRLELFRFLEIFERICQTVAYAHSEGFIHRDLKPDNVMVDEFGDVQVMDWGLAVDLGDAAEKEVYDAAPESTVLDNAFLTRVGAIMGTPAYMAPEQAIGRRDKRTDVFGLGAILCEILTGKPPYVAESASEIYLQAVEGDIEEAAARLCQSEADPELVDLAIRCLSKNPDGRPDDAGELAEAVTQFRRSVEERAEVSRLATVRAEARADEERKRRLTTLVAGGLIAGLLAILGGGAWWFHSQQARRLAVLNVQLEDAIGDVKALRNRALAGSELDESAWAQALEAGRHLEELAASEELDSALENEASDLVEDVDEAEICHQLVEEFEKTRIDQLPAHLEHWIVPVKGLKGIESVFAGHGFDPESTSPEHVSAWLAEQPELLRDDLIDKLNEWFALDPKAELWQTRVLEVADPDPWRVRWRKAVLDRDREVIQELVDSDESLNREPADLIHLAFSTIKLEKKDASVVPIGLFERAQRRHPDDFWLNFWFAWFLAFSPGQINEHYFGHLKRDDAITFSRAALASRPDVHAWFLHGEICRRAGKKIDARDALEQVVVLDPDHAAAHYGLGWVYHLLDGPEKGIPEMAAAARLQPDNAVYLDGLGALYLYSDQLEEAEEILEKAVVAKRGPKGGPNYRLAMVYRKQRRYEEALPLIRKAIELEPDYHDYWIELAYIHTAQNQWPEVESACREAMARNPDHPKPHELLARALVIRGKSGEAIAHYEKAAEAFQATKIFAGDFFWTRAAEAAIEAAKESGDSGDGKEGRRLRDLSRAWLGELMNRHPIDGVSHPRSGQLNFLLRQSGTFAPMRKEERLANMAPDEAKGWRKIWMWAAAMEEKVQQP